MTGPAGLAALEREITACRACPRLVAWREQVAREKRAAFASEEYWGRPIPGFGDPSAGVVVLGLAPAAHGGNRTGRVFTGDRSGDWLFAALHAVGMANQPTSVSRADGLRLTGCWVAAAVRCAPPENRPTPAERDRCLPFAVRELGLLPASRALVCLGGFAWDAALRILAAREESIPRPRPRFAHGAEARIGPVTLLGCYHPSQQNTFTGRLRPGMMEDVLRRAAELAALKQFKRGSRLPITPSDRGPAWSWTPRREEADVKGSIAQCAEELVRTRFGDGTWDEVCAEAGLRRDTYFMPASDVDDGAVLKVVEAIGTVCRLSPQQVADAFGEYWVCEYASRQYPAYFRGATSARELLLKMDKVHELVTRSVPKARPPRFNYSWTDENTLVIDYRSARGLTVLLIGLIKGVGTHYGERLAVRAIGNRVTVQFPALAAA